MKARNFPLVWLAILLLFFSGSCNKEPVTSVISADGVKIAFNQKGKGEPAIIFVHGWSNNKSIWDEQVAHFSEKHKVIAVDLAGFGDSGNNRLNWSVSAFGDDVVTIIKTLKLNQVVLVGFSMGAPVVIEAAVKVPENITGVVLVDDLQNIEAKYSPETLKLSDSILMDMITYPTLEKAVKLGFINKNPELNFPKIIDMLNKYPSRIGYQESLSAYFKWINQDCTEKLKLVKAPVTAINSDSEPTNVEAFRKFIPSFQAKIIPGAGHVVFWDAPEEFTGLLEKSIKEFMSFPQ